MNYIFMTTDADIEAGYQPVRFAFDDTNNPHWADNAREVLKECPTPNYRISWYIEDPENGELEQIGNGDDLFIGFD